MELEPKKHAPVEHFIDRMIFLRHGDIRLFITCLENATAKLFDLRGFKKLQDVNFPTDEAELRKMMQAKAESAKATRTKESDTVAAASKLVT